MSKTRCVGSSLGRSALIDTKKSFIELTSWVISPSVHLLASPCISLVLPDGAPIRFLCFHQSFEDVSSNVASSTGRFVDVVSVQCVNEVPQSAGFVYVAGHYGTLPLSDDMPEEVISDPWFVSSGESQTCMGSG